MNNLNNLTEKFLKLVLNGIVITLSAMSLLGIIFMTYQIFVNGVTGDFGIY